MTTAIVYYKSCNEAPWKEFKYQDEMKAHDEAAALLLEGFIVKLTFVDEEETA